MLSRSVLLRFIVSILVCLLFSPVMVIVTNDSFSYLGQAISNSIEWPISFGFKQAGYAIYLWILDEVSSFISVSIFQLHFVAGLFFLSLAIASVPIKQLWLWLVFLFFTITLVMNVLPAILPEHLLILLCLSNASITLYILSHDENINVKALVLGLLTTVIIIEVKVSAGLMSVPFIYIAARSCLKDLAQNKYRSSVICILFGLLTLLQIGIASFNNLEEFGTFTPVTNTERIKIWGLDYSIRSEGKASILSDIYKGDIYSVIHPAEEKYDYDDRKVIFESTMDEMRKASNLSHQDVMLQQLIDAIFSPVKMNDIGGVFRRALNDQSSNLVSVQAKWEIDELPGASRPINSKFSVKSFQSYIIDIIPIFIISMTLLVGVGCRSGQIRTVLSLYIICMACSLFIHASSYLCNFRYLIVLWITGLPFVFYGISVVEKPCIYKIFNRNYS